MLDFGILDTLFLAGIHKTLKSSFEPDVYCINSKHQRNALIDEDILLIK